MLAMLEEDEEAEAEAEEEEEERSWEWVEVMRKHRLLAGKLELMASGVGVGKGGGERATALTSPSIA